jgi:hypothetical protein
MSATNLNITYPRCKAKNHWRWIDAHAKNGRWPCCYLFCQWTLPICPLCITMTKSLVNYHTFKTRNHWRSIDAHFNVLPSIIVFTLIWLYRLSFYMIVTWPCGKAERHNNLAPITLTRLKMMYHAKRFIAPAVHLFRNRYLHSTSYHSCIIYL